MDGKILLDSGADLIVGIVEHMSPLFFAIEAGQPIVAIAKIVNKGADPKND